MKAIDKYYDDAIRLLSNNIKDQRSLELYKSDLLRLYKSNIFNEVKKELIGSSVYTMIQSDRIQRLESQVFKLKTKLEKMRKAQGEIKWMD